MNLWEEEEKHQNPFLNNSKSKVTTPQFRNDVSRALWIEDMGIGEIIEKKGGMWGNTGIIRNGGRLYCFIEEITYLTERGALVVVDSEDTVLSLKDVYKKIVDRKNGCCWEYFKAYRRLKSLGYIVCRHGVAWTSKCEKGFGLGSSCKTQASCINEELHYEEGDNSISRQFKAMRISDITLFDVYLPDSKFKKSSPGDPSFVLCLIRGKPPLVEEVEKLQKECSGVPLKLCHVDHWLVSFFSYERAELAMLP